MKYYEKLFNLLTWSWYILFGLAYTNTWKHANALLTKITFYYKIFVSLVIMYFFNPLTKTEITSTHKSIIFTAATFILLSEGLMNILNNISNDAQSAVHLADNTIKTVSFLS